MSAMLWTGYGPHRVLRIGEIDKPFPKDGEVLVKVYASTVTAGDCEMRGLKLPLSLKMPVRLYTGLFRPKRIRVLSQEMSGIIESVGKEVTRFKNGDKVFAHTGFSMEAYSEYICLPEDGLIQ